MSEPAEQTPPAEGNDVTVQDGATETVEAPTEPEAPVPEVVQCFAEPPSENKEADQPAEPTVVAEPPAPQEPGSSLNKEEYERQIAENEALQAKLASALSNQEAERDAYRKLTEDNGRLQKHYEDMKEKYDDMEGSYVLLNAEIESYKAVNFDQKDKIGRLESEVQTLKDTQGGDENIKALQEKLIRLSDDQEQKDRTIHELQGELDATKERLKDAEARAARSEQNVVPKSKTCAIM